MTNWKKAREAAEEAMKKMAEVLTAITNAETEEKVQLSELQPGEKFKTEIGNFIVLEQFGNETAVITEELYLEDKKFSSDTTDYNKSSLKEVCDQVAEEEFARIFGAENIVEHKVNLITVDGQQLYENPICKVRPLTFDEARKYNQYLPNKELPDWYWTCTPWSSEERGWKYSVAVVAPSGNVSCDDYIGNCGVRPFCILKSNIFVSKED